MRVFDQEQDDEQDSGHVARHESGLAVSSGPRGPGVVVVTVEGDVDLSNVEWLADRCVRVADEASSLLVVDLRATRFLGVCGAQTLENVSRWAESDGARCRLVVDEGEARRTLDVAGTTDRCLCVPTLADALADAPGV